MDDELIVKGSKTESFLGYMTTITTLEKNELLNVIQYIVLIVIPLVLLLKFMKEYIPPDSASKSSIEITMEVVIQLTMIFIAFWLIHKVIMYIPTYSTVPYEKLNLIQIAMPVVFLLFCMKSSISEKVSILLDRFMTLTGIRTEAMEDKKNQKGKQAMTNQGQGSPNQMPQMPPPMAHSMNPTQQPPMNTSQEAMSMNMNYGISEPMASNEMGSPFGAY